MKDIMGKIFNSIGFDYDDEDEEEEEVVETRVKSRNVSNVTHHPSNHRKSKIVDINTTTQFQVVVTVLERFDDVEFVANNLKDKKPVVVNVEKISDADCQRVIDFLSGVTYALNGKLQQISKGILMATPESVKVMGDMKTELLNGGFDPFGIGKGY